MEIITKSHIDEIHAAGPNFSSAVSDDGLYSLLSGATDYVGINCAISGLADNTIGKTGWHVVYLPQPGDCPAALLAGAREFSRVVDAIVAERKAFADKAADDIAAHDSNICPKCGTYCYGDCEGN